MLEDVATGCIDIDSDFVHGILDDETEFFFEFFLWDIVLIHPNSYTSYGDFYEFGEGIDIASTYRDCSTVETIELWEFFLRDFACRVDGSSGFVDDIYFFVGERSDEFYSFVDSRSVSYDYRVDRIFFEYFLECRDS